MPQPGYDTPRKRSNGSLFGQDPYAHITNPDVWIGGVPKNWEEQEGIRTADADAEYGRAPNVGTGTGSLGLTVPRSSSGSSRRSYGRSGGGSAYAAQLAAQKAEEEKRKADSIAAYDAYDKAMREQYSSTKVDARFDPLVASVGTARDAGVERLTGITDAMNARGVTARSDVADAFSAGDERLRALRAQYADQQAATTAGFNDILAGHGVSGVGGQSGYMDRLFANAQTGNARAATIFDASAADRGALVGGLQTDVETGMTRDKVALLDKIAIERAQAQQQAATSLAQVLADSGLARAQL